MGAVAERDYRGFRGLGSRFLFCLLFALLSGPRACSATTVELHHRFEVAAGDQALALTFDACDGGYDAELVKVLVAERVPATIFVTRKWIRANPAAMSELRSHAELFEIENHGARHIPAIIGQDVRVYGLTGHKDRRSLEAEIITGANAIQEITGQRPQWYRAAAGRYDEQALSIIGELGIRAAGFSVNLDEGAKASKRKILSNLQQVTAGDILLAHLNHPGSPLATALPAELSSLRNRGFHFVRLNDVDGHVVLVRPKTP